MLLGHPVLFKSLCYVDGRWVHSASAASIEVRNPADQQVLEGEWSEDLIVIAFPDLAHARAWYGSPAYQRIVALRTRNSRGDVILMDGVGPDHRALDVLKGTASR